MGDSKSELQLRRPVAVLTSDIHYNLQTLGLADAVLRQAITKANTLQVPLIVAGDMHDTKANLRGECVNAMLVAWDTRLVTSYVIVGNHDKINEKSDDNALQFLYGHTQLVSKPKYVNVLGMYLIPYYHDPDALRAYLKTIQKGSTLIMHQGMTGSMSGDYIQDKSAINPQDVASFRVISGHYHTRQSIKLPEGGQWDYIGNPYTLNYAEANDPPKGFQVLYNDGSLEFVPTNLRKHVVFELDEMYLGAEGVVPPRADIGDLLWVKVHGTREQIAKVTKRRVKEELFIRPDTFRLDLIPTDNRPDNPVVTNKTKPELLDALIDSISNTSDERKLRLKTIWKGLK